MDIAKLSHCYAVRALREPDAEAVLRFFPPYLAVLLREKKPMPKAAGWMLYWAMNRGIF